MESIEFFHYQLSLAREIAVSHKNYILTDRIIAQIQSDNVYVDKSSLCNAISKNVLNTLCNGHVDSLNRHLDVFHRPIHEVFVNDRTATDIRLAFCPPH